MNVSLLRERSDRYSVTYQEKELFNYAILNGYKFDKEIVEICSYTKTLEERVETREFLQNLKKDDNLFIYDVWVLSSILDEVVKIFTCLLKKCVNIHICSKNIVIFQETQSIILLGVINQTDFGKNETKFVGRPKGSKSKSKFDRLRKEIINLLKQHLTVSDISRELNVSRSSLKDYIASRNLREFVTLDEYNQESKMLDKLTIYKEMIDNIKCSNLIKEEV